MPGAAPCGIFLRGATPPGRDHPSWAYPCPTRARGRRLGLPLACKGQPTFATAPCKTTQENPGQQLESPRQAVPTLLPPSGPRPTGESRHGSYCPGTRGLSVGHGQTAPGCSINLEGPIVTVPSTSKVSDVPQKRRSPGVGSPAAAF